MMDGWMDGDTLPMTNVFVPVHIEQGRQQIVCLLLSKFCFSPKINVSSYNSLSTFSVCTAANVKRPPTWFNEKNKEMQACKCEPVETFGGESSAWLPVCFPRLCDEMWVHWMWTCPCLQVMFGISAFCECKTKSHVTWLQTRAYSQCMCQVCQSNTHTHTHTSFPPFKLLRSSFLFPVNIHKCLLVLGRVNWWPSDLISALCTLNFCFLLKRHCGTIVIY